MLTAAQKYLAEQNHNLIYAVLKNNGWSIDEYYGIAAIGLCKAASNYDKRRGVAFTTYAYSVIRNSVLDDIKRQRAYKRSAYKTVCLDEARTHRTNSADPDYLTEIGFFDKE